VSTVTAARDGPRTPLRRATDALPRASIGTAPIIWRNVELSAGREPTAWLTLLDEIARLGYEGTQLGVDFPEGAALRHELDARGLRLAEVYAAIPTTVDGPAPGAKDAAMERLRLLEAGAGDVLCLAVDGSPDRDRWAGRASSPDTPVLTDAGWDALIDVLHEIADAAAIGGHPVVFHPHAATFVETPDEIDRLMASSDPARLGLCLDVGHDIVGGGDPVEATRAFSDRVRHMHLKDVDPAVMERVRAGEYASLGEAVREGLFTELGAGVLDLDGVLALLAARDYAGWLIVEQDWGWGPPSESAAIGRRVLGAALRRLGAESDPVRDP
jgi:inosose dehydratase